MTTYFYLGARDMVQYGTECSCPQRVGQYGPVPPHLHASGGSFGVCPTHRDSHGGVYSCPNGPIAVYFDPGALPGR
jgi:hypothetical protein